MPSCGIPWFQCGAFMDHVCGENKHSWCVDMDMDSFILLIHVGGGRKERGRKGERGGRRERGREEKRERESCLCTDGCVMCVPHMHGGQGRKSSCPLSRPPLHFLQTLTPGANQVDPTLPLRVPVLRHLGHYIQPFLHRF